MPARSTTLWLAAGLVCASGLNAQAQPLPAPSAPITTDTDTGAPAPQVEQTRSRRIERSFYPTGVMQREVIYAMNGDVPVKEKDVVFAASGVLLREQRWVGGEPQLDLVFLGSGVLQSRREYSGMGTTRELRVQTFYASGILATDERYAAVTGRQPTPIGTQKTFSASGLPASERVYDVQGRLLSEQHWSANGQLLPPTTR